MLILMLVLVQLEIKGHQNKGLRIVEDEIDMIQSISINQTGLRQLSKQMVLLLMDAKYHLEKKNRKGKNEEEKHVFVYQMN